MKTFTLQVNITRDHIDRGVPLDPCKCIVAEAIKDAFKKQFPDLKETGVGVTRGSSTILVDKSPFICQHPREIQNLIRNFDQGKEVFPTQFLAGFLHV